MEPTEEEGPKLLNAQVLYREWGRRFTKTQQYLKGIEYYERSIEFGDENIQWTLLGLSTALKKSGQFKKAAEIAEQCMTLDPKDLGAYYTRMEALFDIAEYCYSLVYAHRGLRYRTAFANAVALASVTVDDCVGANVSPTVLRQLQPWIAELEEHRRALLEIRDDEEDEFAGIDEEQTKFKVDDEQARLETHLDRLDRHMAVLYLERSAIDKSFLKGLLRHRALPSANKAGSKNLGTTGRAGLGRLQSQQDALRTRRPMYVVRAQAEAALTPGRQHDNWQELQLRRCLARNLATFMLRQLHHTRLQRNYHLFFQRVERAKDKFEALGLRLLPERDIFLDAVYRMVARAYLDPRNLLRLQGKATREAHLRRALGLRVGRLPRDSELAWVTSLDVRGAISRCRNRLALANRPLEILWIFHELCKLFLQTKRYDLARFYAKKVRDLGQDQGYEEWALNGFHILLRIELAQRNRIEAGEAAQVALESARNLGVDFLVDFYERAAEHVNALDFDQEAEDDGLTKRVREMLALAPEDLRPRLNLLLKAMDAVPASRRLSVMPGCKPHDNPASKKVSVIAAPPEDIERDARYALLKKFAPSKSVPGLTNFDEYD